MYNYIYPFLIPNIPHLNEKPPTIYSILNSIVDFNSTDKTKIKDLAKESHSYIFNFDYPLSNKINKDDFECMILNKFMMRRIGFDTFTAFQIQLNVKLNEIMPQYNILFDSLIGWNLFNDGEVVKHDSTDTRNVDSSNNIKTNSATNNISDRRYSETPQSQLEDIKNGSYITEYNLDNNTNEDESTSIGTSNTNDKNILSEITTRSSVDKISLYKQFIESRQSIYTMIFNDLEDLFYQII